MSSRRIFTKEFKAAALRRLELGASAAEVARACQVNPNVVHRWRRESSKFGQQAFTGYGNNRSPVPPRTRAVVFRLTHDELELLKQASLQAGARSLSDFTRSQILRATGQPSLAQIEAKLDKLAVTVQQLMSSVASS